MSRSTVMLALAILLAGCTAAVPQPDPWEQEIARNEIVTRAYELNGDRHLAWELEVSRGVVDVYAMPATARRAFVEGGEFSHFSGFKARQTSRYAAAMDVPAGTYVLGLVCVSNAGCAFRVEVEAGDPQGPVQRPPLATTRVEKLPEPVVTDARDVVPAGGATWHDFETAQTAQVEYQVRASPGTRLDACLVRQEDAFGWAAGERTSSWACSQDRHVAGGRATLAAGPWSLVIACDDDEPCDVTYSIWVG